MNWGTRRLLQQIVLWSVITCLAACADLAVQSAPEKKPSDSQTALASQANDQFWQALHGGRYDDLPAVIELLTAAYLENPNDSTVAAHLGFAHTWRLSERQRLTSIPATITDDIMLGRKYFGEAVQLDPADARYLGFHAALMMAEGRIDKNEKLSTRGYFTGQDAIDRWPEFNLFTIGYVLSGDPYDGENFRKALDWQWQTMDRCYGETVDRSAPNIAKYLALEARETEPHRKRACWNSAVAPHNVEGFYLNMGDMLVKSGDWQTALEIYGNAKLLPTYQSWPYRTVLEQRMAGAEANVALFRKTYTGAQKIEGATIMFNSPFACMACHQN